MKYFSDIHESMIKDDLDYQLGQVIEEASLLQLFKNLLASKSSIARSIFSFADEDTKEVIKKAINNNKLKQIKNGQEWWKNYINDSWKGEISKKWEKLNSSGSENDYFSTKKLKEYNKVEDMNKALITGLGLMYDIAEEIGGPEGSERQAYVKGVFDKMRKTPDFNEKEYLEKILKKYEASENNQSVEGEEQSEEERSEVEKTSGKVAPALNADSAAIKNFTKSFFGESAADEEELLLEDAKKKWYNENTKIGLYRKAHLMAGNQKEKEYEQRLKNKKQFIALVTAIEAFINNVQGTRKIGNETLKADPVTNLEFLQELLKSQGFFNDLGIKIKLPEQ